MVQYDLNDVAEALSDGPRRDPLLTWKRLMTMVKRLSYEELVQYVDNVLRPKDRGFTSEEINDQLITFCANCPDPAAALDIVIETMGPVTAKELVDKALNQSPRDPATLPASELALTHPLRSLKPRVS